MFRTEICIWKFYHEKFTRFPSYWNLDLQRPLSDIKIKPPKSWMTRCMCEKVCLHGIIPFKFKFHCTKQNANFLRYDVTNFDNWQIKLANVLDKWRFMVFQLRDFSVHIGRGLLKHCIVQLMFLFWYIPSL